MFRFIIGLLGIAASGFSLFRRLHSVSSQFGFHVSPVMRAYCVSRNSFSVLFIPCVLFSVGLVLIFQGIHRLRNADPLPHDYTYVPRHGKKS